MDTIRELDELALATRLKSLSERLSKDVSLVYKKSNIDFEARWFVLVASLIKESPQSITGLAKKMGLSHAAINQIASELLRKGYVASQKSDVDLRKRFLTITPKGRAVFDSLKEILVQIKTANADLINTTKNTINVALTRIEEELDKKSMFERIWELVDGGLPGEIQICEYSAGMKKFFKQLNYEWLEEFFSVEEFDEKILLNPKEVIINSGGFIFFAIHENKVVGTCAILNHGNGIYEIGKMAVTKKLRGYGIGRKLLTQCVEKVKSLGSKELFLLTSEKLIAANSLYKSFGFRKIKNGPIETKTYHRKIYAMIYKIS